MGNEVISKSKLYPKLKETGESARSISKYTITLSQYIEILMEEKQISKKRLAIDSNMSEKMVQRIRNEANYAPSLQAVVAICMGLKTSLPESCLLIDLAGHRIRPYVYEEAIYLSLLLDGSAHRIEDVNECLNALNCKLLGSI